MTIAPEPLILDFLEWIANKPRPYREVMAAWRTSCPKLTVWEDSIDARESPRHPNRARTEPHRAGGWTGTRGRAVISRGA